MSVTVGTENLGGTWDLPLPVGFVRPSLYLSQQRAERESFHCGSSPQSKGGILDVLLAAVFTVLVMSSCIRNWGLVGTPVPEENSERGQKLGSCAYPD